ncbi:hypothetical protein AB0J74_13805 [Asanoa sp. NPDC049573]|uniref:hypothetical protein n=1 Tax=Asanoa sp. NPDC049573 TaxID=3155396 RepID=UPI00343AC961
MSFWEGVWRIGVPVGVVVASGGMVWTAATESPTEPWWPRGWQWLWVLVWLRAAGEAAFGDNRWWFERAWKGSGALLIFAAVAVGLWRRYRWRRRLARDAQVAA